MENAQKPNNGTVHIKGKGHDFRGACGAQGWHVTEKPGEVTCQQCLAKMNDKSAVAPLNTPKVGKLTTR